MCSESIRAGGWPQREGVIGKRRWDQAKYMTIKESESVETEGEPIDVKKKKSIQIQIYALVVPYRPAWEIGCQAVEWYMEGHCVWMWTADIRASVR